MACYHDEASNLRQFSVGQPIAWIFLTLPFRRDHWLSVTWAQIRLDYIHLVKEHDQNCFHCRLRDASFLWSWWLRSMPFVARPSSFGVILYESTFIPGNDVAEKAKAFNTFQKIFWDWLVVLFLLMRQNSELANTLIIDLHYMHGPAFAEANVQLPSGAFSRSKPLLPTSTDPSALWRTVALRQNILTVLKIHILLYVICQGCGENSWAQRTK